MVKSEKNKISLSFEEAFKKLEQISTEMEAEDLPLEQLQEKFKTGMELCKYCQQKLQEVEFCVKQVIENEAGEIVEEPLDLEEEL